MAKVAIVEDEPAISHMYQQELTLHGYEVEVAGDGNAGVELLKHFHPDLILLDIMMPGMNGLDFVTYLRRFKEFDKVKVIMLTNLDDTNMRKSLSPLNINGYVVKAETTPKEIVETIKKALG